MSYGMHMAAMGYKFAKHEDNAKLEEQRKRLEKLPEIEALLEGAAKLHEANDFDHSIALIYVALDKIREIA